MEKRPPSLMIAFSGSDKSSTSERNHVRGNDIKSILVILFIVMCICSIEVARADQCDELVAQEKRIGREEGQKLEERYKATFGIPVNSPKDRARHYQSLCEYDKKNLADAQNYIERRKKIESVCGRAVEQNCGSACKATWLERLNNNIEEACRLASDLRNGLNDTDAFIKSLAVPSSSIANPRQSSGASQPPAPLTSQSSALPRHWQGTADLADCAAANSLERGTAAWYDMCVPAGPPKSATGYVPHIPPQTLLARAKQTCGSPSRETYQCFVDAKVKILLAEDATIRTLCLSKTEEKPSALREQLRAGLGSSKPANRENKALNECVDNAYVYGPKGPPSLSERLWKIIGEKDKADTSDIGGDGTTSGGQSSDTSFPPTHCPPGQGMQSTPGAFGARSCQQLVTVQDNRNVNPQLTNRPGTPDPVQAFEDRVRKVASSAVAAVADAAGAPLSATDRSLCIEASFAAVLSVLKGGAAQVPEKCRPMANAARAELAYYAYAHVDSTNPAVEELLLYLNMRDENSGGLKSGTLGNPLPGFEGLKPSNSK